MLRTEYPVDINSGHPALDDEDNGDPDSFGGFDDSDI